MSRSNEVKLYIGNLPRDVRSREVEDLFYKYGPIRNVDVRSRANGNAFAFVEFEDARDAKDALKHRDGYRFADGFTLRVEYQKSSGARDRSGYDRDRYGYDRERDYRRSRYDDDRYGDRSRPRRGQPPRRSEHRVYASGLPPTGSWQDVKDHVRKAGEVLYADVYKDGTGVIEFSCREDAKRAVRELDGSRFKSHEGDSAVISLKIQKSSRRNSSVSSRRSYNSSRSASSPRRSRKRKDASRDGSSPRERDSRSPPKGRSRSRSSEKEWSDSNDRDKERRRSEERRSRSETPQKDEIDIAAPEEEKKD